MNDLISREDAINAMMVLKRADDLAYGCEIPESFDSERAIEALKNIPSAEPVERTAKVEYIAEVYRGEIVDHYLSGMCGICGEYAYDHAKYCSDCGAKLDWSGNG